MPNESLRRLLVEKGKKPTKKGWNDARPFQKESMYSKGKKIKSITKFSPETRPGYFLSSPYNARLQP